MWSCPNGRTGRLRVVSERGSGVAIRLQASAAQSPGGASAARAGLPVRPGPRQVGVPFLLGEVPAGECAGGCRPVVGVEVPDRGAGTAADRHLQAVRTNVTCNWPVHVHRLADPRKRVEVVQRDRAVGLGVDGEDLQHAPVGTGRKMKGIAPRSRQGGDRGEVRQIPDDDARLRWSRGICR